jgi:hypothetical protein
VTPPPLTPSREEWQNPYFGNKELKRMFRLQIGQRYFRQCRNIGISTVFSSSRVPQEKTGPELLPSSMDVI